MSHTMDLHGWTVEHVKNLYDQLGVISDLQHFYLVGLLAFLLTFIPFDSIFNPPNLGRTLVYMIPII